MAQENYKGIYGNMTFPAYKYQEYPKSIRDPDDRHVEIGVAQDQRDELRILADHGIKASKETLAEIHPHTEALVAAEAENGELKQKLAELEAKFAGFAEKVLKREQKG